MNRVSVYLALLLVTIAARSATLQGSLRDSHGIAIAGATIRVQIGSKSIDTVRSDASGNYRLSSLAAGDYTLRTEVVHNGDAVYGPFALRDDETKTVDLVLKPSTDSLDFSDEPKFTIAGVTDHTYVGGHGSDTVLRSAEALTRATADLAQPHASKAESDERQGKPLDAVREFERAAELDASETNLFNWGTELLRHRAPEPAEQVFTRGTRLYPYSSRMLLGTAVALYTKGDYNQAGLRFFEAADLTPADPNPYLFLGKVQRPEIAESPGFLDRMARFAQLQPDNAWANYYYAISLWSLRKTPANTAALSQVQTLLEKAVRLDSALAPAYLQLGILYSQKKDFPAAIQAYRRAIEVDPQMEQAHYRLAEAYRQTGEGQKAQQELEAFRQVSTTSAQALERRRSELEVFRQVSQTSAQALERRRSELQQFVVTLKGPAPNQ